MRVSPAAYYRHNRIIKDGTRQLSKSLWFGIQPELPDGRLINFSRDPTNCRFDHFGAIFRFMTSPGIHVNNVPIVADSGSLRWELDSRVWIVHFWLHVRAAADSPLVSLGAHHKSDKDSGSGGPDTAIESDLLVFFTASQDCCNSSQALQMNDVNIWTWVQYCLL